MCNSVGSCRSQHPNPVQQDRNAGINPAQNRKAGRQASFESGESASLQVKTAEGDTVSISFAAIDRLRAGPNHAAAESGLAVQVEIQGDLNDSEVADIGKLLETLVSTARSAGSGADPAPSSPAATSPAYESLDSFQFAYQAYSQASRWEKALSN